MKKCKKCYWYESNGLKGKNAAEACRSPKWEWTEEETAKWKEESLGKEFVIRNSLPPFNLKKHCDFRPLKNGKSYIDIKYGTV